MAVMSPLEEALRSIMPERVRVGEPLSRHTTLRVGGPADYMIEAETVGELSQLLTLMRARALPLYILGNGSNLLVSDEGVRGIILTLGGDFAQVQVDGARVTAGGGYNLPKLALEMSRQGLAGLEFACGVPGTVGAGLVINAGAHGSDLSRVVESAEVLWPDGRFTRLLPEEMGLSYRSSRLQGSGAIVLAVTILLAPGDPAQCEAKVRHNLERRRATQPLSYPNAGSIFMNPPGDYAGRLIEAVGGKGMREGDAQIAQKHANFIINLGAATARDVLILMSRVRALVQGRFGVRLEPEVKIWGPNQYF